MRGRLSVSVGTIHRGGKAGYPARLVTYNPGLGQSFLYTTHQDYRSGEMLHLKSAPKARYLENGLQWFG